MERSLWYQVEELFENEINLALYFIYLRGVLLTNWIERNEYNRKAYLYELIGKEIIDTHIKEILDKILNEFDDVVSKRFYDIRNYKLVKYNVCMSYW